MMDKEHTRIIEVLERVHDKECECDDLPNIMIDRGGKCISCQAGGLLNRVCAEIKVCYDEILSDYPMLEAPIIIDS